MMCLALPGRVMEVVDAEARLGRVDVLGTPRTVTLSLVDNVAPGDWVLVHMGVAVGRMTEAEAAETVRLFEELESLLSAEAQAPKEADA